MENTTDFAPSKTFEPPTAWRSGFLLTAGVLLPFAALAFEWTTQLCAENFFDPIPTWWHTFFVFFVAATNLQTWWAIRGGRCERLVWLGFANAAAIFIALFYTVIFAPLLPVAVLGLLALLLGLLPMAPLFSLIAAVWMRRDLRRMAPAEKPSALRWQGLAVGLAVVFLAIGIAEMTFAMTKIGIEMASSAAPEKQAQGLRFIRRYGDENYLLRLCYGSSGVVTTDFLFHILRDGKIFDFADENEIGISTTEKARQVYYRLNGTDFSRAAPPRGVKNWHRGRFDEQTADADGQIINRGLSLAASQIDGSIDGDAAVGYLEWTLVLKNAQTRQQEAVAQIQMPPGAVVSRLTLWINGEEREAAFAKRGTVTEAYNHVVSRQKDPVLITTSGKDRVAMRAFPVPPGGEMKIRIGITAPLEMETETHSRLSLPHFTERNFLAATEHAVWFESKKPLEIGSQNFTREQGADFFAVRGKISNDDLLKLGAPIRAAKSVDVKNAWARGDQDSPFVVRQEIREIAPAPPRRVIFVVDTSREMKGAQTEIAAAIKSFSADAETILIVTGGNGFNEAFAAPQIFVGDVSEIAARVENATFGGGADNAPALEAAWNAAQGSSAAIVWIHAPQTVELAAPQNLAHLWTRRAGSPPVYSLPIKYGGDTTERVLGAMGIVETVAHSGAPGEDLKRLLEKIGGRNRQFEAVRTLEDAKKFPPPPGSKETSAHLVRLWANDEVKRLLAQKTPESEQSALDLAVNNQLVTPVSGAVVLETKAQYDQFGLRPVDANTVPTIPEPEEYLLFGIVLSFIIWMFWKSRRSSVVIQKPI